MYYFKTNINFTAIKRKKKLFFDKVIKAPDVKNVSVSGCAAPENILMHSVSDYARTIRPDCICLAAGLANISIERIGIEDTAGSVRDVSNRYRIVVRK